MIRAAFFVAMALTLVFAAQLAGKVDIWLSYGYASPGMATKAALAAVSGFAWIALAVALARSRKPPTARP